MFIFIYEVVALVIFVVMAYRLFTSLRGETSIFLEFNQGRSLVRLVLLFPLGPVLLHVGLLVLPFPLPFIAAATCYIPAFLIARSQGRAFERMGTDRVQNAQSAISQTIGTSIVGLVYLGFVLTITIAAGVYGNSAQTVQ